MRRLKAEKFPAGASEVMAARVGKAEEAFDAGLADDLNTAQALAAMFDLVRDVNTAIDRGEFRQGDAPAVLAALEKCDEIFDLVNDRDAERLRAVGITSQEGSVGDAEIEALVAERQAARQRRDFAAADRIRKELAERGIILEDTKDGGVRWIRK